MENAQGEAPPPMWATIVVSILMIAAVGGGVYWAVSYFSGRGAPNVEKLAEKEDIGGLIDALSYDGEGAGAIVSDAKDALVEIGSPAVPQLVDALEDGDSHIQSWAASILGDIGDPAAEEAMFSYSKELCENGTENTLAVKALSGLGSDAIDSIEYFLDDEVCGDSARAALIAVNIDYVSSVAGGDGVAAAEYDNGAPGIHPLVIIEDEDNLYYSSDPSWNEQISDDWEVLGNPAEIELVLVFGEMEETELSRCSYGDVMTAERSYRERVRQDWPVTLREAATGDIVATTVLEGEIPDCPEYVGSGDDPFTGRLQFETLEDWLRPYVEG